MNIIVPWALLMGVVAYQYGVKPGRMPEPYRFLGGTALLAFAAIIAQANGTVGALLAWGFFLGAAVYTAQNPAVPNRPRGAQ